MLHLKGWVHGDVKIDNIILLEQTWTLIDFDMMTEIN